MGSNRLPACRHDARRVPRRLAHPPNRWQRHRECGGTGVIQSQVLALLARPAVAPHRMLAAWVVVLCVAAVGALAPTVTVCLRGVCATAST